MMLGVDVEAVLIELEIDFEEKGHEALGLCPMHKERTGKFDHSPSWWINLETGQHICFSCQYKGSLLQLVVDVKGFKTDTWGVEESDFAAAKAWLATVADISPDRLADALQKLPTRIHQLPKPVEMSEARLAPFDTPPEDQLTSRNVSIEAAEAYQILWDKTKSAWVLPLRNPEDMALMGYQEKGTIDRTFMNRPPGMPRSKTLFGLPQRREDVVYLVESPLDCARLYTAGFPGALAICGSQVNEDHVKLVRGADTIISAFDNPKVDAAGKKASADLAKLAVKYGLNVLFFNYGDTGKKDPGDLTDEEIAWGIENAKSSIYGESAYV
jgi:hypothetical protein